MALAWQIARRPCGDISRDDFALCEVADDMLEAGEVRVRNRWLSVDPYVRGLLDDEGSYMPTLPLGSLVPGGAIGEVVESRCDALPPGSMVFHEAGWRDEARVPSGQCQAIAVGNVPLQLYLGHLGMPGQTAYFGLLDVIKPQEGETLFVSAAAGAVGSAVLQIAKIKGMYVIASAGGVDKCALLKELGADLVIDRKSPGTMREKLAAAAPEGIDAYFDNVGGDHLDAALESAKLNARIALCGMVSGYGKGGCLTLPDPMRLVVRQVAMRGFTAPQFDDRRAEFQADMQRWLEEGRLQSPETIVEGLNAVPDALRNVLGGGNIGKMLVKL